MHSLHSIAVDVAADVGPGLDSTSPDLIKRWGVVSGSLHPPAKNTSADGPAKPCPGFDLFVFFRSPHRAGRAHWCVVSPRVKARS